MHARRPKSESPCVFRLLRAHDVTTEANARDAWFANRARRRFDVSCDVLMPGMSGAEPDEDVENATPEQAARFADSRLSLAVSR